MKDCNAINWSAYAHARFKNTIRQTEEIKETYSDTNQLLPHHCAKGLRGDDVEWGEEKIEKNIKKYCTRWRSTGGKDGVEAAENVEDVEDVEILPWDVGMYREIKRDGEIEV